MALENENRLHAALGLSFASQQMIVRVCNGVLLHSIEQTAPGILECDLVDGLADAEAVVSTSIGKPPPPFNIALIVQQRLTPTRWRFGTLRVGDDGVDFGPVAFDVAWFRASGGAPATVPI